MSAPHNELLEFVTFLSVGPCSDGQRRPDATCGVEECMRCRAWRLVKAPTSRDRDQAERMLRHLSGLVAAQRVNLAGLSHDSLRMLIIVIRGLEDRISGLETKVRQPWRH